jgi:hypothetical protein
MKVILKLLTGVKFSRYRKNILPLFAEKGKFWGKFRGHYKSSEIMSMSEKL